MKKLVLVLFIIIMLNLQIFSSSFQTMGIPANQNIIFNNKSSAQVDAYCLEFEKKTPTSNVMFNSFYGDIEITFKDNKILKLSINEAVKKKYIEIKGNNSWLSMMVIRKNENISSIKFSNSFLNEDKGIDFNSLDNKMKNDIFNLMNDFNVSEKKDIQKKIWNSQKVLLIKEKKDNYYTYYKVGHNQNENLESTYFKLEGGGSATLYADVNDNLTLVDTGFTKNDAVKICNYIEKKYKKKNIKLKVFLTHPDKDHIEGFRYMLDRNYNFEEVIFPDTLGDPKAQKKMDSIKNAFLESQAKKGNKYISEISINTKIVHLIKAGNKSKQSKWSSLNLFQNNNKLIKQILNENNYSSPSNNDLAVSNVDIDNKTNIKFYNNVTPGKKNSNRYSLINRWEYNGISHLNMGDADIKLISSLIKQYTEDKKIIKTAEDEIKKRDKKITALNNKEKSILNDLDNLIIEITNNNKLSLEEKDKVINNVKNRIKSIEETANNKEYKELNKYIDELKKNTITLKSNILQWPHHFFIPANKRERDILEDFIKEVDPQKIIITSPSSANNRLKKNDLIDFLNELEKKYNYEIIILEDQDTEGSSFISKISLYDLIKFI